MAGADIEINTIAKTMLDADLVDNGWLKILHRKYPNAAPTFSIPGLVHQVTRRAGANKISTLRIFGHAAPGEQMVGGGFAKDKQRDSVVDEQSCIMLSGGSLNCVSELRVLSRFFTPLSVVELHGCEVGVGTKGLALCRALARLWNVTVRAGCEDELPDMSFTGRVLSVYATGEAQTGAGSNFFLVPSPVVVPKEDEEQEPWPVLDTGVMLSIVAKERYGDAQLWPLVWDYNRALVGENPNRVPRNVTLRVRRKERYTSAEIADARRRSPTWKNYPV